MYGYGRPVTDMWCVVRLLRGGMVPYDIAL